MPTCPVSVIIPTYNRASFLQRAIDSVCKQTLRCSEIIVVNDGSTDNTVALLDRIKTMSKTPILILNTSNKGVAAARNLGVENSRYDVISFLDSDDHWNPKKLEKQYHAFSGQEGYQVSHTMERWLRRGKHLNQKRKHIPRHGNIFAHCLELCAVGMSTVMMYKKLFESAGGFDESMQCCEDYDFWLHVSVEQEFLLIEEPLIVKEGGREDQLSSIYRLGMDERRIYSIRKLLDSGKLHIEQYRLAMEEFERKITIFAHGCLKHGKTKKGNSYLELLCLYQNKEPNILNYGDSP